MEKHQVWDILKHTWRSIHGISRKRNNSKPLKSWKIGPDAEQSLPQNAITWAVREGFHFNHQPAGQNLENGQSNSPTPNTSVSQSLVSTPVSSSAPSLVSTPPNSAGYAALLSPADSPVHDINDDAELEEWIRNAAGIDYSLFWLSVSMLNLDYIYAILPNLFHLFYLLFCHCYNHAIPTLTLSALTHT